MNYLFQCGSDNDLARGSIPQPVSLVCSDPPYLLYRPNRDLDSLRTVELRSMIA